ncbi:MAG TPA: terminase small subunit [Devosia sp.]|nr:terminase small subunit [Devosia sp.]
MTLTAKKERFVQEYLVDLNASQAARRAGYGQRLPARSVGSC